MRLFAVVRRPITRRLFQNPEWGFLVDGVRVRPFHEEMTASLLDEVGRRRTYQRPSETSGNQTVAAAVVAAVAAATAKAADANNANANVTATTTDATTTDVNTTNANTTTAVNTVAAAATGATSTVATGGAKASDTNKTPTSNKLPGGRIHTTGAPHIAAVTTAGTRSPTSSLIDSSMNSKRGIVGATNSNDNSGGGGGDSIEGPDTVQASAKAAARRAAEAERRRAALATIESRRGRPTGSDEDSGIAMTRFSDGGGGRSIAPAPSVASSSTIPSFAANLKLSAAFSAQSVRSGAILGYYGREEVETLFAISKNPSRIAAYNRIIKGKRGAGRDEDGAEVWQISV